jgi:outer membrane protein assembly factor BamB
MQVRILALVVSVGLVATGYQSATPVAGQAAEPAVRMIADEGEATRYWARWRGPSGQGLVDGKGYPDTWSGTDNVMWKVPVPGSGNSSPIVWRDQIFLTTASDDGSQASILAYRRSDGQRLWEAVVPAGAPDRPHNKNGYASATVATDGQRIYASFGGRGLMAVDMSGKQVWHTPIGRVENYHGPAGSPLLYKNSVILYQDQRSGSFVAAFDRATGKQLWRTPRDAQVGWGTPIAIRVVDHDELIVHGQNRVVAYNPDTGAELWRCGGSTFEVIPTPVVGYGMLFCASGRAGPTLAIRPGGKGDVTSTHVAWTTPRGSPFVPSPILFGDLLYTINDMQSIVSAFDARTGTSLWQGRLGVATREGFSASPVALDGKVFFTNDDGETFVLRAGKTFDLMHVNRIGERTLASPALVDGRWYIRTAQHLYAIGRK